MGKEIRRICYDAWADVVWQYAVMPERARSLTAQYGGKEPTIDEIRQRLGEEGVRLWQELLSARRRYKSLIQRKRP